MADKGYVRSVLGGIADADTRRRIQQAFDYVLDNIRVGVPEHQTRAVNTQQYWLETTSSTTANGEFSVTHGLGTAPRVAFQVLDLNRAGAKIVPLEVARVADGTRLYLKSSETSAPITLLVE